MGDPSTLVEISDGEPGADETAQKAFVPTLESSAVTNAKRLIQSPATPSTRLAADAQKRVCIQATPPGHAAAQAPL